MTTVVLGWDGLDYDLAREFGVTQSFGFGFQNIDTLENDALGKPHTWELWPSIITGKAPAEHGIHADEYIESGWSNPGIRVLERLSSPLPDGMRWWGGRLMRDAGAKMAFEPLEYYGDTVFDDYQSLAIAVPNARSPFDDAVGIEQDRGAYLSDYLESAGDDGTRQATVPLDVLRGRVAGDASAKLGMVRELADQHDLVFVWLAYLDTLGHVAPTVEEPEELQRATYEWAAAQTRSLRDALTVKDTLLCVSDHGLQDGEHTSHAVVSGPESAVSGVQSVLGVRAAIESLTASEGRGRDVQATDETAEVQERLENLGYV